MPVSRRWETPAPASTVEFIVARQAEVGVDRGSGDGFARRRGEDRQEVAAGDGDVVLRDGQRLVFDFEVEASCERAVDALFEREDGPAASGSGFDRRLPARAEERPVQRQRADACAVVAR